LSQAVSDHHWSFARPLRTVFHPYVVVLALSLLLVVGQRKEAAYPLAGYVAFCVLEAVWRALAATVRATR
jgi:hypothetical protein